VHFDTHTDTGDQVFGVNSSHGTFMRELLDEGHVDGHRYAQIGLRGYWPGKQPPIAVGTPAPLKNFSRTPRSLRPTLMSGPKHLWSGDWQRESAAASEELVDLRAISPDREPTISPAPQTPHTPHAPRTPRAPGTPRMPDTAARRRAVRLPGRPGLRAALPVLLAAVLLLAAGAYGLTALLGSPGSRASTTAGRSFGPPAATAGGPSVSPASTTPSRPSRPVSWLGMQIETLPPGAAVVETVAPGSPGELAGLEPGDVIVEIDNRPISAAGEIEATIRGLRAGDLVQLQISRGSTLLETQATLAAPPSIHP